MPTGRGADRPGHRRHRGRPADRLDGDRGAAAGGARSGARDPIGLGERYGPTGLRLAGTSIPWSDIRAGRFRRDGRWAFLSFDDRNRVLTLELDRTVPGAGFDVVAVGVDDPAGVGAEIEARRNT